MINSGKIFLVDEENGIHKSYQELIDDINSAKSIPVLVNVSDSYSIFKNIILSMVHDEEIVLADSDLSSEESSRLGITELSQSETLLSKSININTCEDLLYHIKESPSWKLTLFTSGTTGLPKKIVHNTETLTKLARVNEKRRDDIWAFAYNPTHIAGVQIFLQALLNLNTIVYVFNYSKDKIHSLLSTFQVTSISATPTFYRLLFPKELQHLNVKRVTSGGEKFDKNLSHRLLGIFPNAKLLNIYATTEIGSLLSSDGDVFIVPDELRTLVKIKDLTLWIHKSQLASTSDLIFEGEWYNTKDLIEIVGHEPLRFRVLSRASDMINVGGNKVNPYEVEEHLNAIPGVIHSKVYSKPNSVVGNILVADLVTNTGVTEIEIRIKLSESLQQFKIPRIVNFLEEIQIGRTGKTKRT